MEPGSLPKPRVRFAPTACMEWSPLSAKFALMCSLEQKCSSPQRGFEFCKIEQRSKKRKSCKTGNPHILFFKYSLVPYLFPANFSATPMEAAISNFSQTANSAPKHFQTRTDPTCFPFLSSLAICFLTINTVIAAVRSRGDPWTFTFVVAIYVLLMILFWLLRVYDRRPEGSEEKDRLKIPIWTVATALNIVFSYRVAMIMNVPGQCFVWGMAAITSLIGFCMFFVCPTSNRNAPNPLELRFEMAAAV